MNPIDVPIAAACLTAMATITASLVAARASMRASKQAASAEAQVMTADGVPSIATLATSILEVLENQDLKIDSINSKLERHLGWHEGHPDAQSPPPDK